MTVSTVRAFSIILLFDRCQVFNLGLFFFSFNRQYSPTAAKCPFKNFSYLNVLKGTFYFFVRLKKKKKTPRIPYVLLEIGKKNVRGAKGMEYLFQMLWCEGFSLSSPKPCRWSPPLRSCCISSTDWLLLGWWWLIVLFSSLL